MNHRILQERYINCEMTSSTQQSTKTKKIQKFKTIWQRQHLEEPCKMEII